MYGKYFASTFTGSMFGSGAHVFALWGYVIANTVASRVELNPQMLAAVLGMSLTEVDEAIKFLTRPDPNSRNEAEQGRRLIQDGQFQYRVTSHEIYRAMRNEDDRRAYNRQKQAESRQRRKVKQPVKDVIDSQSLLLVSAQAEAEAEAEAEAREIKIAPLPPKGAPRASRLASPRKPHDAPGDDFTEFWHLYPRKTAKGAAAKAWAKQRPSLESIRSALEWQVRQPKWLEQGGEFIPYPASWLNARRWEDEPFNPPLPGRTGNTITTSGWSADVAEDPPVDWRDECKALHGSQCSHRSGHEDRLYLDSLKTAK